MNEMHEHFAGIDRERAVARAALLVVFDYIDTLREFPSMRPSKQAGEALRELVTLNALQEHDLPDKRYTVTYIIGTTYTVQIDAFDEDDAERIFEERYETEYGELDGAETGEITHEVQSVDENSFQ